MDYLLLNLYLLHDYVLISFLVTRKTEKTFLAFPQLYICTFHGGSHITSANECLVSVYTHSS